MDPVGMVLCGGLGKRLRPLTESIPKPLLQIKNGLTLLDKHLLDLKHSGVKDVVLLTGYLHEKIEERYGRNWKGVNIDYSIENEPLGTWGAIANELKSSGLDRPLLIFNGDIISDLNIRNLVKRVNYPITIFVTKMKSPYGVVEIGGETVSRFVEKPTLPYYINAGVYFVEKTDILKSYFEYEKGDIETLVFPSLAESRKLGYYIEDEIFWKSIDTLKDLDDVRKEFENRTEKPWGYEKIIVCTDKYLTKELFIKEGCRTSLHYHTQKKETLYLTKGKVCVEDKDGKKYVFGTNHPFTIEPGTVHSLIALETTLLQEFSTPHTEDTVRIKDYYDR